MVLVLIADFTDLALVARGFKWFVDVEKGANWSCMEFDVTCRAREETRRGEDILGSFEVVKPQANGARWIDVYEERKPFLIQYVLRASGGRLRSIAIIYYHSRACTDFFIESLVICGAHQENVIASLWSW